MSSTESSIKNAESKIESIDLIFTHHVEMLCMMHEVVKEMYFKHEKSNELLAIAYIKAFREVEFNVYKVEFNARSGVYYVRDIPAFLLHISEGDFNYTRNDFPVTYISVDCYGNEIKEHMWLFDVHSRISDHTNAKDCSLFSKSLEARLYCNKKNMERRHKDA